MSIDLRFMKKMFCRYKCTLEGDMPSDNIFDEEPEKCKDCQLDNFIEELKSHGLEI